MCATLSLGYTEVSVCVDGVLTVQMYFRNLLLRLNKNLCKLFGSLSGTVHCFNCSSVCDE
jgi:hypothetical protein